MNWWLLVTPFIAAAMGWLFVSMALKGIFHPLYPRHIAGMRFQGLVPKRQNELAQKIGQASAALFSMEEIREKITQPDNVKKIMPQAEAHIDHFLRVKLVQSMPVVGMLVGDKTINNLKSLFVTELETLFPDIMKNYMDGLQEDFNIETIVTGKIAAIAPAALEKNFLDIMQRELLLVKSLGGLLGFVIGSLQLMILLLLQK